MKPVARRLAVVGVVVAGVAAEVLVFTLVTQAIGIGLAVLGVLVTGGLGGWLLRREGGRGWRRLRGAAADGRPSGGAAADGLVGLLAGVLLLVPGFLTDLVGVLLVVPPVRSIAAAGVRRFAERRMSPMVAGELFGPWRVRAHQGPRRAGPADEGAAATGAAAETEAIEGEIVDGR